MDENGLGLKRVVFSAGHNSLAQVKLPYLCTISAATEKNKVKLNGVYTLQLGETFDADDDDDDDVDDDDDDIFLTNTLAPTP
ncbi:hypothetical protein Tco_1452532 [Tanacetum coccineum]